MSLNINRKRFLYTLAIFGLVLQLPLNACKRILKIGDTELKENEYFLMISILEHLLPSENDSPGAADGNAAVYINEKYKNSLIGDTDKMLIKSGLERLELISNRLTGSSFQDIPNLDKEKVLRELESFKKGKQFLSLLLSCSFEALLGDPIYGINKDEKGWKWLDHIPGSPRPNGQTKYQSS